MNDGRDGRRSPDAEADHEVEQAVRGYRRALLPGGGAFAALALVSGATPPTALVAALVYVGVGWSTAPFFLRWRIRRRRARE